jgi:hypothetical protein
MAFKKNELSLKELKEQYEFVCTEYITRFCKKQGIAFDGWVANEIGGMASFCDQYYFGFNEIAMDVDRGCKKGLILEWQDGCVENQGKKMSYYSYVMGLRFTDIK